MRKVTIAFDVDGTLIDSEGTPNWRITELLRILSRFKNVEIVVWSGGGKSYAESIVRMLSLEKYVKRCASKNHVGKSEDGKHLFDPELTPDIAIDDIQDCELGVFNLIVREK